MNGLLLLDKPAGCTSHDVVARVRKILRIEKAGHAGTLDPNATGLLVLALNQATRWLDCLPSDKRYHATLRLGLETDTEDIWGGPLDYARGGAPVVSQGGAPVVSQGGAPVVSQGSDWPAEGRIRQVLEGMQGSRMQVPPMVSALKHQGRRLYDLARQGVQVEREARPVEIFSLKVLGLRLPDVDFEVHCSSGTYVRSLCAEAGAALGTGGCLAALRRTAVGPFKLEDAVALEAVVPGADLKLVPAGTALAHLPERRLDPGEAESARHGVRIPLSREPGQGQETWRLVAPDGSLLGLGHPQKEGSGWGLQPKKVFLV